MFPVSLTWPSGTIFLLSQKWSPNWNFFFDKSPKYSTKPAEYGVMLFSIECTNVHSMLLCDLLFYLIFVDLAFILRKTARKIRFTWFIMIFISFVQKRYNILRNVTIVMLQLSHGHIWRINHLIMCMRRVNRSAFLLCIRCSQAMIQFY